MLELPQDTANVYRGLVKNAEKVRSEEQDKKGTCHRRSLCHEASNRWLNRAAIVVVSQTKRLFCQVRTKRLANCLYKPRLYHYSSNRFKTRSESDAMKAKEEAKAAENRAREAESKAK